jgi:tetratricopeptide (TPR) repeat protein
MKITTFILCAISSISVISAMPVFSQPSRNNIEEAEILLRRAINEYNNQNYAYYGAIHYLDQSIKLDPENADAYFLRGNINRFAGNRPNAFDDYSKAIKLNPNYAMAYYNRGIIRIGSGYPVGPTILDLLKSLQTLPVDAKKYNSMGLAIVQLDDSQEVIQRRENIETQNPPKGFDFVYRGVARYRLGDRQGGIEDIKKGAEIFRRQGDSELQTKILDLVKEVIQRSPSTNSQPVNSKPETCCTF